MVIQVELYKSIDFIPERVKNCNPSSPVEVATITKLGIDKKNAKFQLLKLKTNITNFAHYYKVSDIHLGLQTSPT